MSFLIDEVARTLATPMPRRRALRFLSSAVAAGMLGTLGLKEAGAQQAAVCNPKCKMNETCCNGVCCTPNQVCCGTAKVCCKQNQCVNGRCKASS
jgi:hypothetical protein